MSRVRPLYLLGAIAAILLIGACSGGGGEDVPAQDVVRVIPWSPQETATYRILNGEDVRGSGVLTITLSAGTYRLEQRYEREDGKFKDITTATVDASTLKPLTAVRKLIGPEGERDCTATYGQGNVEVVNRSKTDSRTDTLALPEHYYDSTSDLFLWRTIQLERGLKVAYQDMGTCGVLAKPSHSLAVLEVLTEERVRVPAGTFDTWRVEIRSGGSTQKFWIAEDASRALVRYDNGNQVFELESIKTG